MSVTGFAPYVMFTKGECRAAMTFYQTCLGGDLDFKEWEGTKFAEKMSDEDKKGIMHSTLAVGKCTIMACDAKGGPCETIPGNDIAISANFDSVESIQSAYEKLSVDANVIQALDKTFWGAWFAQFIDKYDKRWMLHYMLPADVNEATATEDDSSAPKKQKVDE